MRLPVNVRLCLLLAGLLIGTARAQDDTDPVPGIHWMKSWKAAIAEAKAHDKPIMIHFSHDSESVCHEIASRHFRDEKIIELSRKFVCVVGNLGDHGGEESLHPKGDAKACPRYGSCTCAEHRKTEVAARTEVLESNTATAPQFVFVDSDLEILVRRPFMLSEGELIDLMERALVYHDPSALGAEKLAKRAERLAELLEQASSDHAGRRKEALDIIARRDDPEIIEFLLKQTSSDVDEVKRNEAIKAIASAGNANCMGRLTELLRDRSAQIRRNATLALRELGMAEAVPALVKAYGIESSSRGKAVIIRTLVTCSSEKAVRKLLVKALGSRKALVRVHAVRGALELPPDATCLGKIAGLARGDSDGSVRAVACHAGTAMALDAEEQQAPGVDKIRSVVKRKLRKALRSVAARDRDERIRTFASACLAALDGEESSWGEDVFAFHDDDGLLGSSEDD